MFSLSVKCKARGFTVIVDGRKSQWNIVKTVVLMLQVQTHNMDPINDFITLSGCFKAEDANAIDVVSECDPCRGVAGLRGEAR